MSDSAAPNPARAAEAQDREDHPPADDFIGSERASPIGWLFLKSPRATRLLGDLQGSYAQLHRRRNAEALTRADRQHVSTALVLCRASLRSLKRERIEEGWIALHAAKRTEVLAMTEAELGPLALALKKEGEDKAKFRNWRGAAIACLADQARATSDREARAQSIQKAMELRDERLETRYYVIALTRSQIWILSLFLMALLVVLGISLFCSSPDAGAVTDASSFGDFLKRWLDARFQVSDRAAMTWFYVAIATMGALGAIASALRSFSSTGDDQEATERRATERLAAAAVTLSRPFIGAVSALVVVFGLISSLLGAQLPDNAAMYLVVAFASGFSERLFVRTIESASAEQKREERSSDR